MAKRTTEHIVLVHGNIRCLHCFAAKQVPNPVDLNALRRSNAAFAKTHKTCPKPKEERCCFCNSPNHKWEEHVNATCKTAQDWPACEDTGLSSTTIFEHFTSGRASASCPPLDPADFGRCFRLLAAPWAKGWRERLDELTQYPGWARYVEHWAALEWLYIEERGDKSGTAPKLYALMEELHRS